jgi:hypothetical protein
VPPRPTEVFTHNVLQAGCALSAGIRRCGYMRPAVTPFLCNLYRRVPRLSHMLVYPEKGVGRLALFCSATYDLEHAVNTASTDPRLFLKANWWSCRGTRLLQARS